MNNVDVAIELLERSVTFMTEHGWHPGASYNPTGGRCIANTIMDMSTGKRRYLETQGPDDPWGEMPINLATTTVRDVILEDHGCSCPAKVLEDEGPIPHFNDYHCAGRDQAIDIYNRAIKALREQQG